MAEVNLAEIKFGGAVGDRQTAKLNGYTVVLLHIGVCCNQIKESIVPLGYYYMMGTYKF